ncbi:MAG TPA: hypothetical protein VFB78_14985 [Acidimicrobiales bacterium]|nr:hypothetical protein [Acidimicrobiales bacterium]
MFKRLFWLMIGAGFGFGTSFWVMRFVRSTVERYSPDRVSQDMTRAVRGLGRDLRAAVADGRDAMRDYQREMHLKLEVNGHAAAADHLAGE